MKGVTLLICVGLCVLGPLLAEYGNLTHRETRTSLFLRETLPPASIWGEIAFGIALFLIGMSGALALQYSEKSSFTWQVLAAITLAALLVAYTMRSIVLDFQAEQHASRIDDSTKAPALLNRRRTALRRLPREILLVHDPPNEPTMDLVLGIRLALAQQLLH